MAQPLGDPAWVFDPTKQTYMDYLNQWTGFGQKPQSPFPAETSTPMQVQVAQAPKASQGANAAAGAVGTAGIAQQAANWLPSSSAPSGASSVASAAPSTAAQAFNEFGATAPIAQGVPPTLPAVEPGFFAAGGPAATAGAVTAGALVGGEQLKGGINAAQGKPMSTTEQVALALPTFGASFLYNPARKLFGHSDNYYEGRAREDVRGEARKSGWLDQNNQVALPDTTLDLSINKGGYTNAAGENRRYHDIDATDKNTPQAIGWLNPLAAVLGKGDPKLTSDFTGHLYNELTKDGKATDLASIRKRVVSLYNQFGLKPSIVADAINQMNLDEPTKNAYLAAIDNLRPGRDFQSNPGAAPAEMKPMGTGAVPVSKGPQGTIPVTGGGSINLATK